MKRLYIYIYILKLWVQGLTLKWYLLVPTCTSLCFFLSWFCVICKVSGQGTKLGSKLGKPRVRSLNSAALLFFFFTHGLPTFSLQYGGQVQPQRGWGTEVMLVMVIYYLILLLKCCYDYWLWLLAIVIHYLILLLTIVMVIGYF